MARKEMPVMLPEFHLQIPKKSPKHHLNRRQLTCNPAIYLGLDGEEHGPAAAPNLRRDGAITKQMEGEIEGKGEGTVTRQCRSQR